MWLHSGSDEELGRSGPDTSDSAECLRYRTSKVMLQAVIVRRDYRNQECKYANHTQQVNRATADTVSRCHACENSPARQQQAEITNRGHAAIPLQHLGSHHKQIPMHRTKL